MKWEYGKQWEQSYSFRIRVYIKPKNGYSKLYLRIVEFETSVNSINMQQVIIRPQTIIFI